MKEIKLQICANGITYVLVCDCYVPDSCYIFNNEYVGYYGNKRLCYLMEHEKDLYRSLVNSDCLTKHLISVNEAILARKADQLKRLSEMQNSDNAARNFLIIQEECLRIEVTILGEFIYS